MSLTPGLTEGSVEVAGERIAFAAGGAGPPVLLLHGYPQTKAMWHRIVPALAERFCVVAMDLPGYGASDAPAAGPKRYAKRRMASDARAVMRHLGHEAFALVGHDRGARVGYRLAIDTPEAVTRLAVLDIVPTGAVWDRWSVARAMRYYHWTFLAQPAPLPEVMIGRDPVDFLDRTMARWTKTGDLCAFDPDALAAYRTAFSDPARIAATCDDYRAGATLDWEHDRATTTRVAAPVLVLWGDAFDAGGGGSPLAIWRDYADDVVGQAIDAGHFLAEENPEATLAALVPFLTS